MPWTHEQRAAASGRMRKWWDNQLLDRDSLRFLQSNNCLQRTERIADAKAIMSAERERTAAKVEKLALSSRDRDDVHATCLALRRALNDVIARSNRPVHLGVGPIAMRLVAEEIERIVGSSVASALGPHFDR